MNCVEIVTVWVEKRLHSTARILSISPTASKKNLLIKTVEMGIRGKG